MSYVVGRDNIESAEYLLSPFESEEEYKSIPPNFCDDEDLDEFFLNDALNYEKDLICKTFKFVFKSNPDAILGLVGLANDAVTIRAKNQKRKLIHYQKRYIEFFPAVKIARLGITKELKGKGLGKHILDMLKFFFLSKNRTACRFLTVDAYSGAIDFYRKNGFIEILDENKEPIVSDENLSLFYDLKKVSTV